MIFSKAHFSLSAVKPLEKDKEVLFIGRSNVGKSSLINAICDHKGLAYVSKTPGHTRLLNYFEINPDFYLVDAPGYGYRKIAHFQDHFDSMMDSYFQKIKEGQKRLVLLLFDARRDLSKEDWDMLEYLKNQRVKTLVIYTKEDKLNQSMRQKALQRMRTLFPDQEILFVSSLKKKGVDILRESILKEMDIEAS